TAPRISSKASAVRHLGAERLGRFEIDDKFEFGRAGTPEPSGRSCLAQGGNVFAVSVASSLAEAEQRQASGRRAPNRSFVKPEFCRISGPTCRIATAAAHSFAPLSSREAF